MAAHPRTNNFMVTAGDGASSQNSQYAMLTNPNNRPKPRGLAPPSIGERRGSKSSANPNAMSMDSKMIGNVKGGLDRSGNSTLINAGRSTVSTKNMQPQQKGYQTSNYLANNAALGRLPTLGLGKIKLEEVG